MINDVLNYLTFLKETGERELVVDIGWLKNAPSRDNHQSASSSPNRNDGITGSPVAADQPAVISRRDRLAGLFFQMKPCQLCSLAATRKKQVFGAGSATADVMIIGEAPGEEEDRQGLPFVGPAGQLLDRMLNAIDLNRKDLFITNVLKCRPPGNRNPLSEEIVLCTPYLFQQIAIIQPRIILCLGLFAAQTILQTTLSLHQLRQRVHDFQDHKVIVTYHPSALLRNANLKPEAWNDLKLVRKTIHELQIT
ncbi:MAG: uracil-DNA glycosylase [Candidatus Delongbacteria bacterium]|nr:uracil-DNA glycosylase [Candidatus Delongbacteria bacterium]